ncbi:MAG: hypothetical protein WC538_23495 [Thermoanaerobaculia bacterium]|jgi:anti-sigma factor RsiW
MQELDVSTIRRFILGDLDEAARRAIEAEALESDELFETIEAVEDEIIEEFLSGTLPASERKIFDESLEQLPDRRHRVELVKALAARKAGEADESAVVQMKERLRYANHARLAIAAGFGAAAITAVAFFQVKKSATDAVPQPPRTSVVSAPAAPTPAAPQIDMSATTSSALTTRQPGAELASPLKSPADSVAASQLVTFLLSASSTRSASESPSLGIDRPDSTIEFQIAIDDNEFSHYNIALRAADGAPVASQMNIPVTAYRGAPVIRMRVPGKSLGSGRYELVIAGVHERGTVEVAYLEFDVTKR